MDLNTDVDLNKPVKTSHVIQKKQQPKPWSNMASVVYARTYARHDEGPKEVWSKTVERVIRGNIEGHDHVKPEESSFLEYLMLNRKASPAGRGLWYSGAPSHKTLGGAALNNCWFLTGDDWHNLVIAQDLLMLGGGVGMSVEREFVSKLPRIKKDVHIVHKKTADADFIVPDSREGWCELHRRVLEAFFVTGKSFSYSTILVRGKGESIKGFGGTASGPLPLIDFVETICKILTNRQGKNTRPIDMADLLCTVAHMVVAGNVRRSALMIQGDGWDKTFLKVKRWDLHPIPKERSNANFSVVCEDIEDLHPLFWASYAFGEPIGIINRTNMQKYGRMADPAAPKNIYVPRDHCLGVNPCAEATLEDGEPCNLQEVALPNIDNPAEFYKASTAMHRWGKRVTMEDYHHEKSAKIVAKNRRIGTGITGCLQSDLFTPDILDTAYKAIAAENVDYSAQLGIAPSNRLTVIKPSGTLSKVFDIGCEGIHGEIAKWAIQTIRFAAEDPIVGRLKAAGHYFEPKQEFDGSIDHGTLVGYFYRKAAPGAPVAGEDLDTWQQLEHVKMAQKYWADQSVSVTVYYKKEEVPQLKEWLKENLKDLKTISFLLHTGHGFVQAPKQPISEEEYEAGIAKISQVDLSNLTNGYEIDNQECAGGHCPIK